MRWGGERNQRHQTNQTAPGEVAMLSVLAPSQLFFFCSCSGHFQGSDTAPGEGVWPGGGHAQVCVAGGWGGEVWARNKPPQAQINGVQLLKMVYSASAPPPPPYTVQTRHISTGCSSMCCTHGPCGWRRFTHAATCDGMTRGVRIRLSSLRRKR